MDKPIIERKTMTPCEEAIPDEKWDDNRISVHKMSVGRKESKNKQESRGPRIRFDNYIASKSRSRSKYKYISKTRNSEKFKNQCKYLKEKATLTYCDKSNTVKTSRNMKYRPSIQSSISKPPLSYTKSKPFNIGRVKYYGSKDQNVLSSAYNSLMRASNCMKVFATTK